MTYRFERLFSNHYLFFYCVSRNKVSHGYHGMSHVVSTAPPQPIPASVCPCYQLVVMCVTPRTCSPYLVRIQPLSSERLLGTTSDWICSRARRHYTMCTGKCSRFIAVSLYPLALLAIICNIVLFFPDGDTKYAKDGHITEEVKYMGGVIGGGVMVSLYAFIICMQV